MTTSATLLRAARPDDVDGITDLHTRARTAYYEAGGVPSEGFASADAYRSRRESWLRAIRSDGRTVVCAERDGGLVGIVSMGPPHESDVDAATAGQLCQIHVRPDLWGQGVGGRLHAAFVAFLRDASLTTARPGGLAAQRPRPGLLRPPRVAPGRPPPPRPGQRTLRAHAAPPGAWGLTAPSRRGRRADVTR